MRVINIFHTKSHELFVFLEAVVLNRGRLCFVSGHGNILGNKKVGESHSTDNVIVDLNLSICYTYVCPYRKMKKNRYLTV